MLVTFQLVFQQHKFWGKLKFPILEKWTKAESQSSPNTEGQTSSRFRTKGGPQRVYAAFCSGHCFCGKNFYCSKGHKWQSPWHSLPHARSALTLSLLKTPTWALEKLPGWGWGTNGLGLSPLHLLPVRAGVSKVRETDTGLSADDCGPLCYQGDEHFYLVFLQSCSLFFPNLLGIISLGSCHKSISGNGIQEGLLGRDRGALKVHKRPFFREVSLLGHSWTSRYTAITRPHYSPGRCWRSLIKC